MGLSDVVSGSFRAVVDNPKALLPTLAYEIVAVAIIFALLGALSISGIGSLANLMGSAGGTSANGLSAMAHRMLPLPLLAAGVIVAVLVLYLPSVLLNGLYMAMGSQTVNRGRLNLRSALATAKSRYVDMLLAGILASAAGLAILVALVAGLLILVALAGLGTHIATAGATATAGASANAMLVLLTVAVTVIVAIIVITVYAVYFFMTYAAVILEGLGPVGAIKRSFAIASSNRWEILALFVICIFIAGAFDAVVFVFALVPFVGEVVGFLLGVFLATWFGLMPAHFYYNFISAPKSAGSARRQRRG
jgi:hypothetical protein